jgi:large subunit ribosomal protein L13
MEYTIDATNEKLGRIASKVAHLLMGKNDKAFARNKETKAVVTVTNASKISITEKKKQGTTYARYSGYPGGLTIENLETLAGKKGYAEVLKKTVYGMLPKNKLRSRTILNLKISE